MIKCFIEEFRIFVGHNPRNLYISFTTKKLMYMKIKIYQQIIFFNLTLFKWKLLTFCNSSDVI